MRKKREYHGATGTRPYRIWGGMLTRCYNCKHRSFKYYGARGIRVCKRWRTSFLKFLTDMGCPKKGHTLDRINNNKGYCFSNCKWSTAMQQANNRSYISPLGKLSRKYKIPIGTLRSRKRNNWPQEKLSIPRYGFIRRIRPALHSKSGILGVSPTKNNGWHVSLQINKKRFRRWFNNFEEAVIFKKSLEKQHSLTG